MTSRDFLYPCQKAFAPSLALSMLALVGRGPGDVGRRVIPLNDDRLLLGALDSSWFWAFEAVDVTLGRFGVGVILGARSIAALLSRGTY